MRHAGGEEEAGLELLINHWRKIERVVTAFFHGIGQLALCYARIKPDMRIRQETLRRFREVIRFILAESMPAEIPSHALHLCVCGMEMKWDRLTRIEEFDQHTKLSAV